MPADVVVMVVGDEDVVDLRNAGGLRGCGDAVGVAGVVAGPAGVDEEGLAGGGDEEGGLAAFYVDEVDPQGGLGAALRGCCLRGPARR